MKLDWHVSRHGRRLFALSVVALGLAVVLRRPELVALCAPALVVLFAWPAPRPGTVKVVARPSSTRVFEGEQVAVDIEVSGHGENRVELVVHPGEGARAAKGADRSSSSHARLAVEMALWGRRRPGTLEVALWDRARLFESHALLSLPEIDCYPLPAPHRGAAVLGRLANRVGDHAARSSGDGVEFAGVRQYAAGDRQRSINWSASTRRGRLQVNTFAAERSQDIILIVDATSDIGQAGSSSVDHALRGALGVARTYLDSRDRVGLVFFGQRMRWLAPGLGDRQFFRLMDALMAGRAGWSPASDIARLPRAALPSGAAVVAFSPLLDARFVEMLRDLRQRNFSVIAVDVLSVAPSGGRGRFDRLTERIWNMERQAIKFSLSELGITVVRWDGTDVLGLPGARRGHREGRGAGGGR
jgi:uncharacterized protein (DUF58 family)